ncbi:MAG: hypothetical protein NTY01_19930 [Verrucomicrobia bacterium]|nr:hypothetical protein [Verrucomicrobiota bacterium]
MLGYVPASPMPNSSRTANNDANPPTQPVAAVISDHHNTIRVSISREPNRSASQPLGTSNSA